MRRETPPSEREAAETIGPLPVPLAMAAAPFAAVGLGLYVLRDAWAAILLYHVQIAFWGFAVPRRPADLRAGCAPRWLLAAGIASGLTALLLLLLLDTVLRNDVRLDAWLVRYGLDGASLSWFVPYYGVVHPVLEELHWDPLRRDRKFRPVAHVAFAGYHGLVLVLLLDSVWVLVSLAVLAGASITWARLRERLGGLCVPLVSHGIADAALMGVVAWIATR
ncbi:MAG: hypothetical protein GF346_08610 [Candidatus Eisenbacteria bacterium]|nr:hypothetical protein [Candidatus Latescibacterota bacterium]MBD3302496.1 hypothetical protein [Candidatus Eisenbacteria bacterium]